MAPGATNSLTSQQLYESLPLFTDQESGTIRVLDLRGDGEDAPLAGTLRVIRLPNDDFFAFSALSYVWGQRRFPPDTINCNGCDLPITASCHDALRALRVNHGPITIWVDAICINQANMGEKAAQIPLMPEIYSSATPVYIYLGQGSELFSQALKVVSTASELKDNDIEIPESVDKSEISHRLSSNIETMETMAKDAGIDVRQIDLDCEWLHRAWTWQEIMLAAHPLFLWGTVPHPPSDSPTFRPHKIRQHHTK